MAYYPTAEQVAVAWILTVPGVPAGKVATTLPGDTTTWADAGFLTVRGLAGPTNPHLPVIEDAVQVDAWANNPNSHRPPWGKAGNLANTVWHGTYADPQPGQFSVLEGFHPVQLRAVFPLSRPRRVPGDEAAFARYQFDLMFVYALAEAAA